MPTSWTQARRKKWKSKTFPLLKKEIEPNKSIIKWGVNYFLFNVNIWFKPKSVFIFKFTPWLVLTDLFDLDY